MTEQTVTHASISIPIASFNQAEWSTIEALKDRYRADHDLFTAQERARLEFVRWLYQSGRLQP